MRIFLALVVILWGVVYFGRGEYYWELAMSFLPYWMVVFFIGLIISIFSFFKVASDKFFSTIEFWIMIWFIGLFWGFLAQFLHFYGLESRNPHQTDNPVRVIYSNLYKENSEYQEIYEIIKDKKSDLILFVEYSQHHQDNLWKMLEKEYPYKIMNMSVKGQIWSAIFSKYPLRNVSKTFEKGERGYLHAQMTRWDNVYQVYLIHTTSPTSLAHFQRRNVQLNSLAEDLSKTYHSQTREKVLVIWDFNVSPWSIYYQQFARKIDGILRNTTARFPFMMTRSVSRLLKMEKELPTLSARLKRILAFALPIESHIDHVFISPKVAVDRIQTVQFPGSDHKGYSFDMQ